MVFRVQGFKEGKVGMTIGEHSYQMDWQEGTISLQVENIPLKHLIRRLLSVQRDYERQKVDNLSPPQQCFS